MPADMLPNELEGSGSLHKSYSLLPCNAMDKLNLFDSNYLYFIFCDLPLKRLVYFVHTDIKFF